MRVEDVMTRAVCAVRPDATLKEVAEVLATRRIAGVPVVDEEQHVLGVVSEADFLAKQSGARPFARIVSGETRGEFEAKLHARTAGDAMTRPAVTVYAHAPLAEAARLMVEREVNRLPVLGRDDTLLGIVTRADVVRAFTRSDAEIAHEIREEVLRGMFWIPPETVGVEVSGGEVELSGEVGERSVADLLALLVERVAGVVSVRSRLAWRVDDVRETQRS